MNDKKIKQRVTITDVTMKPSTTGRWLMARIDMVADNGDMVAAHLAVKSLEEDDRAGHERALYPAPGSMMVGIGLRLAAQACTAAGVDARSIEDLKNLVGKNVEVTRSAEGHVRSFGVAQ